VKGWNTKNAHTVIPGEDPESILSNVYFTDLLLNRDEGDREFQ
jgi:hypothetical protein